MENRSFLAETEKRLRHIFNASKEGYKASPVERNRLEGFMSAGVFLELTTNNELKELLDRIHFEVFGKTIEDRKAELQNEARWREEAIDYTAFDSPSFERKK